jgi:YggT family protein
VTIVCTLLTLFYYVLLLQVIMSWVPTQSGGFAAQLKHTLGIVTEPVLRPIRSVVGPVRIGAGALDLSPIIAFFGIVIIQRLIGC